MAKNPQYRNHKKTFQQDLADKLAKQRREFNKQQKNKNNETADKNYIKRDL